MSYILKALRKSEAERAKGAVPKLTPHHEPMEPRRGSIWPWVAVAALVVNAVIGGAMLWRSDIAPWLREMGIGPDKPVVAETMPAQPATQGATSSQTATAVAPRAAAPLPPSEPETKAAPQPAPSPPPQSTQSSAGSQSAEMPDTGVKPSETSELQDAQKPAAEKSATAAAGTAPAAGPKAMEAPDAAARVVAAIEQTPPPKAAEPPAKKPAKQIPMAPEPPRKPAQIEDLALVFAVTAEQEEQLADEPPWGEELNGTDMALIDDDSLPPEFAADLHRDVPMLWQMPRSFRSRVPQIQISVHVYSPDEPRRFVIINRKKYWEGDNLLDGVILEAIVPDGVVMEYRGQQFRLSSSR